MRLPPAESAPNGSSGGSTNVRGPLESWGRGALEQIAPGIATRLLHAECARGCQSASACASAIVVIGFVFDRAPVRILNSRGVPPPRTGRRSRHGAVVR